jgi:hypothetical protein
VQRARRPSANSREAPETPRECPFSEPSEEAASESALKPSVNELRTRLWALLFLTSVVASPAHATNIVFKCDDIPHSIEPKYDSIDYKAISEHDIVYETEVILVEYQMQRPGGDGSSRIPETVFVHNAPNDTAGVGYCHISLLNGAIFADNGVSGIVTSDDPANVGNDFEVVVAWQGGMGVIWQDGKAPDANLSRLVGRTAADTEASLQRATVNFDRKTGNATLIFRYIVNYSREPSDWERLVAHATHPAR